MKRGNHLQTTLFFRITKVIHAGDISVVAKWISTFSIANVSYSNSTASSTVAVQNVWKNLDTNYATVENKKLTFLVDCEIQFTCTLKSYQLNTYYSTHIYLCHNSTSLLSVKSYMKGGQTVSATDTFTLTIAAGDTLYIGDWRDADEDGDSKTWCTISEMYVIE